MRRTYVEPCRRPAHGRRRDARPLSLPGELCASLDGFSLHAKVALGADGHAGRERLCRYLARPTSASECVPRTRRVREVCLGHGFDRDVGKGITREEERGLAEP